MFGKRKVGRKSWKTNTISNKVALTTGPGAAGSDGWRERGSEASTQRRCRGEKAVEKKWHADRWWGGGGELMKSFRRVGKNGENMTHSWDTMRRGRKLCLTFQYEDLEDLTWADSSPDSQVFFSLSIPPFICKIHSNTFRRKQSPIHSLLLTCCPIRPPCPFLPSSPLFHTTLWNSFHLGMNIRYFLWIMENERMWGICRHKEKKDSCTGGSSLCTFKIVQ